DLCIVLDQNDAETCHASLSLPQTRPFNQTSISLSGANRLEAPSGLPSRVPQAALIALHGWYQPQS
ncbi:MAG: hypothetical protein M3Y41_08720, partial [Pseudomonadota bacterium]|nr:hypothetical protein [Pseudomonadota bacterium]